METLKMNVNGKVKEVILPVVGSLGTMYVGSDSYIVVCTNVISNKKVVLRHIYSLDKTKDVVTDEYGYEYLTPEAYDNFIKERYVGVRMNETEEGIHYSLRKNGVWYPKGQKIYPGCCGVRFGHGVEYSDPSF